MENMNARLSNISTCMWVRPFIGWANVYEKQFHACDNSEIAKKIETELRQARIYVNDNRCSKKSRKQHSHKRYTKSDKNAEKDKLRPLTCE